MSELKTKVEKIKTQVKNSLIVSCQAPENSPLRDPHIIAAIAKTAELNGARAVRIDSPEHISEVKKTIDVPVFGIYKIISEASEVYITPTLKSAYEIAEAGADVIALDATLRSRPNGERPENLCREIKECLKIPLMADVSNFDEGIRAAEEFGCDFISTTLSGYTSGTSHLQEKPDFCLVEKLSKRISVPVICEGRLRTSEDVTRAFAHGAFAVVVGKAITGIDSLTAEFAAACKINFRSTTQK